MTIKVRQRTYKETGRVTWQADIHVKLLDGRIIRERCKVPTANSRTAAERWAKEREAWLIRHGYEQSDPAPEVKVQKGDVDDTKKPIPTLAEFAPRWYAEHGEANRHRPATLRNKDILIRNHLIPFSATCDSIRSATSTCRRSRQSGATRRTAASTTSSST